MRILVATCLLFGACAFSPGAPAGPPGDDPTGPDAGASDAAVSADPAGDGGTPVARTCRYPDPALRLCVEFEDHHFAPRVTDGTALALDPIATLVTERTRGTQTAASFGSGASMQIAETTALDLSGDFTLELWTLPTTGQQTADLLVNAGQYVLALVDGKPVCKVGNASAADYRGLSTSSWTHVACTLKDGVIGLYVNGSLASVGYIYGGASTQGTQGTRIGTGLVGGLDDLRVYARELSNSSLCTHAGRTSCF